MTAKDDAACDAGTGTAVDGDLDELIRLLTSLARKTRPLSTGEQVRYDFGEIVTRAITATAANLGSVHDLLAGRPGSWEADYVRQIVASSAGSEDLLRYRTEPVKLVLDPEEVFLDIGLRDLYDEEDGELASSYHNGTEPDDGGVHDSRIDDRRALLEQIYKSDLDRYVADYADSVREVAIEWEITVPVTLERISGSEHETDSNHLAESIHAVSRLRTPLPSGIALQDYLGDVATVEREAGRSYLERLRRQMRS